MNNIKKIHIIVVVLIVIFIIAIVLWGSFKSRTTISFEPSVIETKVKDSFTVNVYANSAEEQKSYTIRAGVRFSPDQLQIEKWDFSDGWMEVSQPGYDVVDNTKGMIIKTAGFPGGWTGKKLLGVITFSSKESSTGVIGLSGKSFVLNEENTNVLFEGSEVKVKVLNEDGTLSSKKDYLPTEEVDPNDILK